MADNSTLVVTIGSDHRGLEQRKVIAKVIQDLGHEVDDQGVFSEESADYPDVASLVARRVTSHESDLGILVCGTGIGMSIAANKIRGIRAALCCNEDTARLSREHNDANVLCLADSFQHQDYEVIVKTWLATEFSGGRHARRVSKVVELESNSQASVE